MAIANQEMIRDNNRRIVLEYLVNHPPVSRAALSEKLHLTKATISNIVQDLIEQHLIREIGSAQTALGRKPILLEFIRESGYALSIDVRPNQIITLLSDLKGGNCRIKEHTFSIGENLYDRLCTILHGILPEFSTYPKGIVGIAIGIYGVVQNNHIIFTPYYPLPDPELGTKLETEFSIPVTVENEANLSVLGESAFHSGCPNMIHINIHEGVGMGILIDEQLYKGKDGYAGEFGHTILFPDGKLCPCGNQGCFELYASEKAILEEYAVQTGQISVTMETFLRAYQKKDASALALMDLFVKYMSIGINNIINTFNTDLIVINSSFTNYIPDMNGRIVNYLACHQNRDCKIISSRLQDISGLMGGVKISVERFLGIQHLQLITPDQEEAR